MYLGMDKCDECGHFGHLTKHCWNKQAHQKRKKKNGSSPNKSTKPFKRAKREETHATIEECLAAMDKESVGDIVIGEVDKEEELIVFAAVEGDTSFYENSDEYNSYDENDIDVSLSSSDWLADSTTMSHITNQRNLLEEYKPMPNLRVAGVGNVSMAVKGKGTVILHTEFQGRKYSLQLESVLYIPTNKNNLLSLGRWEKGGRQYVGRNRELTLVNTSGNPIAKGIKIKDSLYKMDFKIQGKKETDAQTGDKYVFACHAEKQTWETWHKRFRHISYKGLQRLKDLGLVQGLEIDLNSPMPDCIVCTEAKLAQEPFKKITHATRAPGELTHIDVWGKYDTVSIEGHQYYVLFVDNAARYITVHFLKRKDKASSRVMEYLAYLRTQEKPPKVICVDRGKEFINDTLLSWCCGRGIDTNMTAPYSPSQNGVAECMNRMLVELLQAMLTGQNMPEFLWEQAVTHMAYMRNRAYTGALETATPYEVWFQRKLQVAHLREFGVPVWVLLQGQKVPRKMLPKSKHRAFIGFKDGPKAIRYYNTETRKILTSRNYCFLSPQMCSPPEETVVTPDVLCKGESRGSALPPSDQTESRGKESVGSKRKQPEEEEYENLDTPCRTCGKCINYCYLNNPFPDEEEESQNEKLVTQLCTSTAEATAQTGGDKLKSLREAQSSSEWLEWEHAVNEELDQLRKRGTWILVKPPADAIPINNKWVFTKKFNKDGDLLKYKGRLVVKGCVQQPGQDYTETFSPVIRLETLRAILALAVQKDLHICQLDVKGAYLNGTLKEMVYMCQPEGYDDKTGHVCCFIKTLYGLKQSGREWNNKLDQKLKKHRYNCLQADPCAYIRREGVDNFAVITVWVDDLMLFANSAELNKQTKKDLQSEWDITDLGQPSKIVGIKITCTEDMITILQKMYIKTILSVVDDYQLRQAS
jgi:transposase InsO family protein